MLIRSLFAAVVQPVWRILIQPHHNTVATATTIQSAAARHALLIKASRQPHTITSHVILFVVIIEYAQMAVQRNSKRPAVRSATSPNASHAGANASANKIMFCRHAAAAAATSRCRLKPEAVVVGSACRHYGGAASAVQQRRRHGMRAPAACAHWSSVGRTTQRIIKRERSHNHLVISSLSTSSPPHVHRHMPHSFPPVFPC